MADLQGWGVCRTARPEDYTQHAAATRGKKLYDTLTPAQTVITQDHLANSATCVVESYPDGDCFFWCFYNSLPEYERIGIPTEVWREKQQKCIKAKRSSLCDSLMAVAFGPEWSSRKEERLTQAEKDSLLHYCYDRGTVEHCCTAGCGMRAARGSSSSSSSSAMVYFCANWVRNYWAGDENYRRRGKGLA